MKHNRILVIAAVLAVVAGCGKNAPDVASPATPASDTAAGANTSATTADATKADKAGGAIITKKLADLTKDDLVEAVKALGWEDKPQVSDSTSGKNENIMLSTRVEDPAGYHAPNGKFYATKKIFLAIYGDEASAKAFMDGYVGRGYVVKQERNRTFGTMYQVKSGADKAKSQAMFDKLLGKQ